MTIIQRSFASRWPFSCIPRSTVMRRFAGSLYIGAITAVAGCKDLVGSPPLPAGVQSPATYNTYSGALEQARGAVSMMSKTMLTVLQETALFTDEGAIVAEFASDRSFTGTDGRVASATVAVLYAELHAIRAQTRIARGALLEYAPTAPSSLRAQMYALEAYAEVFLADIYCSGVPLTTVNFPEGITYRAGSTTSEVYKHAAVLFDSAIVLSSGQAPLEVFARVGLARALLAAGLLDSAAKVVESVSDTGTYIVRIPYKSTAGLYSSGTVSDREGRNGLNYISSSDPRSRTQVIVVTDVSGRPPYNVLVPTKFLDEALLDSTSVVVASGIEARLIAAEVDLKRGGTEWLSILNALRTNGVTSVRIRSDQPGVSPGPAGYPDTTWGAGSGVGLIAPSVLGDVEPTCAPSGPCTDTIWYRGLRPLKDPGDGLQGAAAMNARVDLLFRERAFWLLSTGHRQGDLRRLIRQYGRNQVHVYPTGLYAGAQGTYGDAVVFKIPDGERRNRLFKGCLNYGA